jgi:hypothetical protein
MKSVDLCTFTMENIYTTLPHCNGTLRLGKLRNDASGRRNEADQRDVAADISRLGNQLSGSRVD